MSGLKPMDSFLSFRVVEKQIDMAVKKGELSREKARSILTEARESYRQQKYNKAIQKYAS